MCKEHLIAKGTVHAFLKQRKRFSLDQVNREILKRNGILRISQGVTVSDYLLDFENRGLIRFLHGSNEYTVVIR